MKNYAGSIVMTALLPLVACSTDTTRETAQPNNNNNNMKKNDNANNCNKNKQNKRKRWHQNTDCTLSFRYEDSIDWARVTRWKAVYPPEYDPHEECIFDLQPMGDGVKIGVIKLPCGHVFKKNMVKRWLDKHARCPLCYHHFDDVNSHRRCD